MHLKEFFNNLKYKKVINSKIKSGDFPIKSTPDRYYFKDRYSLDMLSYDHVDDFKHKLNIVPYWGNANSDIFWNNDLLYLTYFTGENINTDFSALNMMINYNERVHYNSSKSKKSFIDAPMLSTKKNNHKYGYYSFLMKIPYNPYVNVVVRLVDGYSSSYIDVVNYENDKNRFNNTYSYYTIDGLIKTNSVKYKLPKNLVFDEYLEYGLLWEQDKLTYYINGYPIKEITKNVNKLYGSGNMRIVVFMDVNEKYYMRDNYVINAAILELKKINYYEL